MIIYKNNGEWIKTSILSIDSILSTNKNNLFNADDNYLIAMDDSSIFIFNNETNEWNQYSNLNIKNIILSMIYYKNQYFIYVENIGILVSYDLFTYEDTIFFKNDISKIYSNFIIYNHMLYISNINKLHYMGYNNIWHSKTINKTENIISLTKYSYITNTSMLNNNNIEYFPNTIFLVFDNKILKSNNLGIHWDEENIDNIPDNIEKIIIDDVNKITLFKDYDIDINSETSILKVIYKNTDNINTIIQFDNEYGKMTHLLYRSKLTFDTDFDLLSNFSQTVQLRFKVI